MFVIQSRTSTVTVDEEGGFQTITFQYVGSDGATLAYYVDTVTVGLDETFSKATFDTMDAAALAHWNP